MGASAAALIVSVVYVVGGLDVAGLNDIVKSPEYTDCEAVHVAEPPVIAG
jgi:hypothetical protein